MPRLRTGTVVRTRGGLWQPVVTLADGGRLRLPALPAGTSEDHARDVARAGSREIARRGLTRMSNTPVSRTTPRAHANPHNAVQDDGAEWFELWCESRRARGLRSVREDEQHYRGHIAPHMGGKGIKGWTREDMRDLCRALDMKVQASRISWKKARNIWATACAMCGDACASKLDELRVRDDDPTVGVRAPERGAVKALQFLYPSEMSRLLACDGVPPSLRVLVAVATYTYLRLGELCALRAGDVDLEHRAISVRRAADRLTGQEQPTKGRRNRRLPIEPTVLRLLTSLVEGVRVADPVLHGLHASRRQLSDSLRYALRHAGVDRSELFEKSPTTRPIRFHDLRATGITWMAVRGDDPLKIQARAGHTEFSTTSGYIRLAEGVEAGFGEPFPELPAALLNDLAGAGFQLDFRRTFSRPTR